MLLVLLLMDNAYDFHEISEFRSHESNSEFITLHYYYRVGILVYSIEVGNLCLMIIIGRQGVGTFTTYLYTSSEAYHCHLPISTREYLSQRGNLEGNWNGQKMCWYKIWRNQNYLSGLVLNTDVIQRAEGGCFSLFWKLLVSYFLLFMKIKITSEIFTSSGNPKLLLIMTNETMRGKRSKQRFQR